LAALGAAALAAGPTSAGPIGPSVDPAGAVGEMVA